MNESKKGFTVRGLLIGAGVKPNIYTENANIYLLATACPIKIIVGIKVGMRVRYEDDNYLRSGS